VAYSTVTGVALGSFKLTVNCAGVVSLSGSSTSTSSTATLVGTGSAPP
jgi:hypothetical protein